jgi:ComF family protein
VPLYRTRQRQRGFNQSALLAGAVARTLGRPLLRRALVRLRPTATQTHLTAAERMHNVEDAFRVRDGRAVEGRRMLLVDDVMTTGATLDECAAVLMASGTKDVVCLTLARGA